MNVVQSIWKRISVVCLTVVLLWTLSMTAMAANESVTFGSEEYEGTSGGAFPVGVYLASDSEIAAYEIEIEFDADRLACQNETAEGDLIILQGSGNASTIRQRLVFDVISGGEAYIRISRAEFTLSDGTSVEVDELGFAPIYLEGEDTAASAGEPAESADQSAEAGEPEESEEPAAREPEAVAPEETPQQQEAPQPAEPEQTAPSDVVGWFLELETLWKAAICGGAGLLLIAVIALAARAGRRKRRGAKAAPKRRKNRREEIPAYENRKKGAHSGAQPVGRREAGRSKTAAAGTVRRINPPERAMEDTAWALDLGLHSDETPPSEPAAQTPKPPAPKPQPETAAELAPKSPERPKKQAAAKSPEKPKKRAAQKETSLQTPGPAADEVPVKTPVISVQNVTMIFRVATSNVSGLKEFLIQKVKHQISYREFRALNDVSFDVFKGEVVGIIGTNGSGKSTMLRIVSGALKPTSGSVLVDRNKVQLLTLGTGFDMELTAKENVYLNGSIIGYSREFLDKHYNEIVEFAELGDFMEEKVKNFSSGMVSRLGFSIATAGGAAEILILDEVLSVGDEFFRKKSLARIKEMIHGGSTVLMVSHGMGTILENCTKVVWIEKGDLRMIGDPKKVCAAYRKLNG